MYALLDERRFSAELAYAVAPKVHIRNKQGVVRSGVDTLLSVNPLRLLLPYLSSIDLHDLRIRGGDLLIEAEDPRKEPLNLSDIRLLISDFYLDSTHVAPDSKPFRSQNIELSAHLDAFTVVLPDSSYALSMGQMEIDADARTARLDSIRLIPLNAQAPQVEGFFPSILLSGVDFREIYMDRRLRLQSAKLLNPRVEVHQSLSELLNAGTGASMQPTRYDITVDTVMVEDAALGMCSDRSDYIEHLSNFDLSLSGFSTDSTAKRPILFSQAAELNIDQLNWPLQDSLYRLNLHGIRMDSRRSAWAIDSFHLIPRYEPIEFAQRRGFMADRMDLRVEGVSAIGADVAAALNERRFIADSLTVSALNWDVFRDKRIARDSLSLHKPLFQELLLGLGVMLDIDTLLLSKGMVRYREIAEDGEQPGVFFIDQLSLALGDVCNDLGRVPQPYLTAMGYGRLMGDGYLAVHGYFPMADTGGASYFSGSLGEMDARAFNPVLGPAAYIWVNDGQVNAMQFAFSAGRYISNGRMRFHYKDLNISVLNKKKGNFKGFESLLANTFVVKAHNPTQRILRIGKISFTRDPERSFIHFWYKSLLSGISSSIGLRGEKERARLSDWFRSITHDREYVFP